MAHRSPAGCQACAVPIADHTSRLGVDSDLTEEPSNSNVSTDAGTRPRRDDD